jgi:hypothetical protein
MLSAECRDPSVARERVGRMAITTTQQIFSLAWNPLRRPLRLIADRSELETVRFGRRQSCTCPRRSAAAQEADHLVRYINRLFSARSGNSSISLKKGPSRACRSLTSRWVLSGYNEPHHSAVPYSSRTVSDTHGAGYVRGRAGTAAST